jgi:hypothetical protein
VFAYNSRGYTSGSSFDLRKEPAHPFMPRPETSIWLGPDDRAWAGAQILSPSRLGRDDIRVPDSGDLALGPAVSRQSLSFQSVLGGGLFFVGYSGTLEAWSSAEVDYVDMNGDLFPDVVSGGHVQYTTPRGGLEAAKSAVAGFTEDDVRHTGISSTNFGLGADASFSRGDAQGKGGAAAGHAGKGKSGKSAGKPSKGAANGGQKASLGIGFGFEIGHGDFDVEYDLVDVNGDGLPDRVMQSGGTLLVALNLGYRFGAFEPWGEAVLSASTSSETSIEPGWGSTPATSRSPGRLLLGRGRGPLRGADGHQRRRPRRPRRVVGDEIAGINTERLSPARLLGHCPGRDEQRRGARGRRLLHIPIGPSASWAATSSSTRRRTGARHHPAAERSARRRRRRLRGPGGDRPGRPAPVSANHRQDQPLRRLARPLGTISIEYRRDGNTYEMPDSRWVLSSVTVNDGQRGRGR